MADPSVAADFLWDLVAAANFMRLSLRKAHTWPCPGLRGRKARKNICQQASPRSFGYATNRLRSICAVLPLGVMVVIELHKLRSFLPLLAAGK